MYLPGAQRLHVLNATARLVWDACDGTTALDQLASELSTTTSADIGKITREIEACVRQFEQIGAYSTGDDNPIPSFEAWSPVSGRYRTSTFAVLDDGVAFHCDDAGLVSTIDEMFGSMIDDRSVTMPYGVVLGPMGEVSLSGRRPDHRFVTLDHFVDGLPMELNKLATRSRTCIVLHSGAVRAADGVLLLPGVSGAGKTTLTAALVHAGWDYVTDEAAGVRDDTLQAVAYPKPLGLDAAARKAVGLAANACSYTLPGELRDDVRIHVGDAGEVAGVVLPRFKKGASLAIGDTLPPLDAFMALIEHAVNLAIVGQPGFNALVQLAARVPVRPLVHGDVTVAVEAIQRLFPSRSS